MTKPGDIDPDALAWRVRLFGGPILIDRSGSELRKFRSQKVRALLGYLALPLGIGCSRENLCTALWPDGDPAIVANRFRVALASLRRQLEPSGVTFGSVLDVSEPRMVRLRSEGVTCDYIEFLALWRAGKKREALSLSRYGLLLSDVYEDWAIDAQLLAADLLQDEPAIESHVAVPILGEGRSRLAEEVLLHTFAPMPLFLTKFFGRESEEALVKNTLATNRLVTLTGIGGIGKTRLACEAVRDYKTGKLFVPLGAAAAADGIVPALFYSLCGERAESSKSIRDFSGKLKQHGDLLLILDNAEHVVEAVADACWNLLEQNADLHILVTSRQILSVPGEAVISLAPLNYTVDDSNLSSISASTATQMFLDRARSARSDFALTDANAPAVAEICRRLEGIPLALELAAARVTSLTVGQIAHSLRSGFDQLKSGQRGVPPRHRALSTAIESSIDLLTDEVQEFLFALAAFRASWTLEMAQSLTSCVHSEEYLNLLAAASLIESRTNNELGVVCYSFMQTVRSIINHQVKRSSSESIWEPEGNLIVNGSFEDDPATELWSFSTGALFPYPFIVPSGWHGTGIVNVNMPNLRAFSSKAPHGLNTGVIGHENYDGRLFQEIDVDLHPGDKLELNALIGRRKDSDGSGRVMIETLESVVLAVSDSVHPTDGNFQQVTLTHIARRSIGTVRLALERTGGTQCNFDCVSLTMSRTTT